MAVTSAREIISVRMLTTSGLDIFDAPKIRMLKEQSFMVSAESVTPKKEKRIRNRDTVFFSPRSLF
jgi:hypothetical protein